VYLDGWLEFCRIVAWSPSVASGLDACSDPPRLGQAELALPVEGVFQRPHVDDLAVAEPEDPDLIDPLEATPGGGLAEPCSQVGGRAGEPGDHLVAFGDQLHDLDVDVGEAGLEGRDPALGGPGQLGRIELVDDPRWPLLKTSATSRRTTALLASDTSSSQLGAGRTTPRACAAP
jgi:hypothetical protein